MQTNAVMHALRTRKHATNAILLTDLQVQWPELSATTVHRITKRLIEQGRISMIRSPLDGSVLLDANPRPHYHFACQPCGKVEDICLSKQLVDDLQVAAGTPIVHDALVITGVKVNCPHYHG